MSDTIIWIDVREPDEFATGYYGDSINIPYESIGEKIAKVTENKNADIRVYCRTGRRSGVAQETLSKMGYINVINEGGLADVQKKHP